MLDQWYWLMPNSVLFSKELTDKQKLLFCLISSLCAEKWYCRATNDYIGELLNADKRTISRNLSELEEKWFITIEIWIQRKISLDKNVYGGRQKCLGGVDKNVYQNNIIEYKDISKDISIGYSDLYKNYYWKNKWINETVCNKLLDTKLKQWITLDDIKIWMMLYNTECRIKQEYRYVKKFETWIKEFQPLTEEQIEETLTRLIKQHKEKKKSDPKYTKWILAKTVWNDLCDTFWKDRVNGIFKRESSSETILNFT